ncbi:hypothetical protein D9M68_226590 [compost metagenome]
MAENAVGAGKPNDVVDRQEIGFVRHVADQCEFMLELLLDGKGDACRIATVRADIGLCPQIVRRRDAIRDHFLGILITELVQRELAQVCDVDRLRQVAVRVNVGESQAGAQVLLGVRQEVIPTFGNRAMHTDGSQHVMHRLARAYVHGDVAGGDDAQVMARRGRFDRAAVNIVHRLVEQTQSHPSPAGKGRAHPCRLRLQLLGRHAIVRREHDQAIWQPLQMLGRRFRRGQVAWGQHIGPLGGAHARERDQLAQVAIAFAVTGKRKE